MTKARDLKIRLLEKLAVRGPDDCWLWTAYCDPAGYGRLNYKSGPKYAHRLMWEVTTGAPCPEDLEIRHLCEERYPRGNIECRKCCNPAHLLPGTHSENSKDSVRAGRWGAFGRKKGSKYSAEFLAECSRLVEAGVTQLKISVLLGVPLGTMNYLVKRSRIC